MLDFHGTLVRFVRRSHDILLSRDLAAFFRPTAYVL